MEVRARYVVVGLFALAVIVAGFGFVFWLNNVGGLGERTAYRIRFESSVSGLLLGSAVQFNGIRVGEVTGLGLHPEDPRRVDVTIAVAAETPVRSDTQVRLVFGGLTGVPEIALAGGLPDAPPLEAPGDGGPPILIVAGGVSQDWTEAAREAFARIDQLLADNSEALKSTLDNLDTFSDALARNSDSVDSIIAGLERMTGGRGGTGDAVLYSLTAPDVTVETLPLEGQLVVYSPTAPIAKDTTRFLVETEGGEQAAFEGAQWSDSIPKLLQSTVIRTFENAGFERVANDLQGLSSDYGLAMDIRGASISAGPDPVATVDFTAKVTDSFGAVLDARRFQASAPLDDMSAQSAAAALDTAFSETIAELVPWALSAMPGG